MITEFKDLTQSEIKLRKLRNEMYINVTSAHIGGRSLLL